MAALFCGASLASLYLEPAKLQAYRESMHISDIDFFVALANAYRTSDYHKAWVASIQRLQTIEIQHETYFCARRLWLRHHHCETLTNADLLDLNIEEMNYYDEKYRAARASARRQNVPASALDEEKCIATVRGDLHVLRAEVHRRLSLCVNVHWFQWLISSVSLIKAYKDCVARFQIRYYQSAYLDARENIYSCNAGAMDDDSDDSDYVDDGDDTDGSSDVDDSSETDESEDTMDDK